MGIENIASSSALNSIKSATSKLSDSDSSTSFGEVLNSTQSSVEDTLHPKTKNLRQWLHKLHAQGTTTVNEDADLFALLDQLDKLPAGSKASQEVLNKIGQILDKAGVDPQKVMEELFTKNAQTATLAQSQLSNLLSKNSGSTGASPSTPTLNQAGSALSGNEWLSDSVDEESSEDTSASVEQQEYLDYLSTPAERTDMFA